MLLLYSSLNSKNNVNSVHSESSVQCGATSICYGILVKDDSGWISASLNIGEVQKKSMIHQDSGVNKVKCHISGLTIRRSEKYKIKKYMINQIKTNKIFLVLPSAGRSEMQTPDTKINVPRHLKLFQP